MIWLHSSPPTPLLYLIVGLYSVAGLTSFGAAYLSLIVRRRPLWSAVLLTFFGVAALLFSIQYSRLTIPGFPGFPISSDQARPYFFMIGLAALSVPVGVSLLEHSLMIRDSLERRLVDSERQRLAEREEYLELKEALLAEREEFIIMAVHEIRTPLTLFKGYLEMLEGAETLEEVGDHVQALKRASGRFYIMQSLFDARLLRVEVEPFDFCGVISDALADPYLYTATRSRPGEIAINVVCDPPLLIEGDRHKVRVILFELIRNALKAVDPGGTISLTVWLIGEIVGVAVEDDGVGIPENYREEIWKPGSQYFDVVETRRNEGLGYGLYTILAVARMLGGAIRLHSTEVGGGSVFLFTLPVR